MGILIDFRVVLGAEIALVGHLRHARETVAMSQCRPEGLPMRRDDVPPRFVVPFIALALFATTVFFITSPSPGAREHPSACEAARLMKAWDKPKEHNFYFAQCRAQGGE